MSSKEESDAIVAKAHSLRDQLENCTSIAEHKRITEEYANATGIPMMFPVKQYDELLNKATPEELEALWKDRNDR